MFAGNVKDEKQKSRVDTLGKKLGGEDSFLKRFTPGSKRYDSVIEVLTVHSAPRQETTIFDFKPAFRPWDEADGYDYWKIFVDDQSYHEGHGEAYKNYGIDPNKGCALILRPDQYVSWIGEMDDYEAMDKFFSGFMLKQPQGNPTSSKSVPVMNGNGGANGKASANVEAGDEAVAGMGGQ